MRSWMLCALAMVVFVDAASADDKALSRRSVVAHKALSALVLDEQKLLYAELLPDVRAGVWKVHLQEFLAASTDLTPAQTAVIEEAIGLLQSGILNIPSDAPEWPAVVGEPIARLNDKITLLFDRDTAMRLFTRIGRGVEERGAAHRIAADGRPQRHGITVLTPEPSGIQDCECSRYSDWCWSGSWCNSSISCKSVPFCGTFWSYTCDGMCVTPYPK